MALKSIYPAYTKINSFPTPYISMNNSLFSDYYLFRSLFGFFSFIYFTTKNGLYDKINIKADKNKLTINIPLRCNSITFIKDYFDSELVDYLKNILYEFNSITISYLECEKITETIYNKTFNNYDSWEMTETSYTYNKDKYENKEEIIININFLKRNYVNCEPEIDECNNFNLFTKLNHLLLNSLSFIPNNRLEIKCSNISGLSRFNNICREVINLEDDYFKIYSDKCLFYMPLGCVLKYLLNVKDNYEFGNIYFYYKGIFINILPYTCDDIKLTNKLIDYIKNDNLYKSIGIFNKSYSSGSIFNEIPWHSLEPNKRGAYILYPYNSEYRSSINMLATGLKFVSNGFYPILDETEENKQYMKQIVTLFTKQIFRNQECFVATKKVYPWSRLFLNCQTHEDEFRKFGIDLISKACKQELAIPETFYIPKNMKELEERLRDSNDSNLIIKDNGFKYKNNEDEDLSLLNICSWTHLKESNQNIKKAYEIWTLKNLYESLCSKFTLDNLYILTLFNYYAERYNRKVFLINSKKELFNIKEENIPFVYCLKKKDESINKFKEYLNSKNYTVI